MVEFLHELPRLIVSPWRLVREHGVRNILRLGLFFCKIGREWAQVQLRPREQRAGARRQRTPLARLRCYVHGQELQLRLSRPTPPMPDPSCAGFAQATSPLASTLCRRSCEKGKELRAEVTGPLREIVCHDHVLPALRPQLRSASAMTVRLDASIETAHGDVHLGEVRRGQQGCLQRLKHAHSRTSTGYV